MTMISKSLCSAEDIRVQEIVSGRVLHTRIPGYGGHNHIDLLNVYQHAWDQRAEAGELKRKRAWILAKIDACIQQIPWRNLCICAGDWNVQLEPMSDLIGNSTNIRVGQAQSAPDMASLTDVMIARQLVGLNTWTGPKRKAYTFTHNGGRTQIDFVFARKHQVTRQMRSCHALEGFPVTAWRQSGLHRPLQVSLDYRWIPSSTPQQSRRIDHDAIATAVRQCTPQLHDYQLDVQTVMARNPPRDTSALHQVLYDCCLRHFPASTQRREYAHNHAEVRDVVHSRWLHLQRGKYHRRFAAACMSSAWHCWHHFARFRALRREANKASRTARRQRYENLLQEAEKFARQQNTHKMFSIIRQLAPKQPHRKVKIYGKEGEILSRQEEVACLKKHFCDIFQGASCDWTHPMESPASPPAPETICAALERIPLRKAVPAHMAPGAAWRAAARQVTDLVHQEACKVWVVARPITGHYAYREIRGLTQAAGNSVFARRSGHTAEPYTGGLILSLDMTTAFDTVPRAHVRDSLIEAGVAQSDVSIIMSWLTGATYHLKHAHINLRIITERGVRQGCPLSPLVWACFTCYIAKRLTDVICLDDLQIYADDFIWSCIFHTKQQFLHTLRTVPLFIQKLRQYGLRVNLNKTAVLIRMARQEGKALLKLHLYQIVSLFGGVLPAVSLAAGSQRPPATPQQAGRGLQKSGLTERPPKYHKHQTNGKGKGNGKGRYKDKRPREDSEHTSAQEGDNLDPQLIPLIAQLCLRFEDAINILRLDRAYVMLFKTKSEESIVKPLDDLSQRWEELKEAKQTDSAKRIALFKGMLLELQTRIKGMIEKEDKVKQLIQMGWMSKQEGREPMWLPLVWNVEQQKDVPCPDMGPLPHTKAMQALDTLLEYACGQVIHRFHPTRPLVPEHAGEILEFKMEVSLKGVAPTQVHDALTQLSNSALWLLIGARMRPDGLRRSATAQQLQKLLAGRCCA
ncbi:unnamed protein product [Symbiodinium sp. CCMP2592]|nr:unnamed protein product [Symbiodinium sp. CCMP2592]